MGKSHWIILGVVVIGIAYVVWAYSGTILDKLGFSGPVVSA